MYSFCLRCGKYRVILAAGGTTKLPPTTCLCLSLFRSPRKYLASRRPGRRRNCSKFLYNTHNLQTPRVARVTPFAWTALFDNNAISTEDLHKLVLQLLLRVNPEWQADCRRLVIAQHHNNIVLARILRTQLLKLRQSHHIIGVLDPHIDRWECIKRFGRRGLWR